MRNVWGTDRRDFLADSSGLWQNQMLLVDVCGGTQNAGRYVVLYLFLFRTTHIRMNYNLILLLSRAKM